MAIGNYYNDLTMLTFAGLGIAMDNSPLEVKAAADDITASNNEEGVRLALRKYCLPKE
ncbi:putative phosphatase [compost metagenome]